MQTPESNSPQQKEKKKKPGHTTTGTLILLFFHKWQNDCAENRYIYCRNDSKTFGDYQTIAALRRPFFKFL